MMVAFRRWAWSIGYRPRGGRRQPSLRADVVLRTSRLRWSPRLSLSCDVKWSAGALVQGTRAAYPTSVIAFSDLRLSESQITTRSVVPHFAALPPYERYF